MVLVPVLVTIALTNAFFEVIDHRVLPRELEGI
ncbi:putative membrane protein [Clostridium tetanomorphum]|nr:putative membrane protein [Clostridium tetanomorphum]NRS83285.1 putative membrane protein [Clostridium tetanomorphum]NRZ96489.1 putative membrane protein [Clostridium tetanomorphum]SQC01332.1 Uncharacterised protein [Clostridium tetanomorphum]